jgi:hypothetical protein
MDEKIVRKLEHKLEHAIFEVIAQMGLRKLPLLPSHHTVHLMAKAAVTVYEAAFENLRDDANPPRKRDVSDGDD